MGKFQIQLKQTGFTFLELFIVIAMLFTLSSIALPVALSTHEQADSVQCLSNLRQMHVVLHAYRNRHRDYLPHEDNGSTKHPKNCGWFKVLPELVDQASIFTCPSESPEDRSYKMNSLIEDELHPFVQAGTLQPQKVVVFFDGRVDNKGVKLASKGTWAMATDRHPDGTHLLLLNGTVASFDSNSPGNKGWESPGPFVWKPYKK